ncbi:MAG: IPT/TIG domain-containing protein [Acidobacteriota bacterium]
MKFKKTFAQALLYCLIISLIAVQAGTDKVKLGQSRKIVLPSYSILDENAQPVISANGKIGFVSSITDGSLLSFNTSTGKILSSIVVGESVGPITLIENSERRLIAVPAANLPTAGNPATVSIIDATKSKQLELRSIFILPNDAQITPKTQAYLSRDGKFCVIAASFNEPTLYAFSLERGQLVSQFPLIGRPSEMAFFDDGARRQLAIASAAANTLSLIKLNDDGQLISSGQFTPADARFEETNNPAFSLDGASVYMAAGDGDKLYAVNVEDGSLIDTLSVDAPQRISVAKDLNDLECIGVTRIRRPINVKSGGATIIAKQDKKLAIKTQFTPPEGIEFSTANNLAFNEAGTTAFIASTTGVLFAFSTATGELESYQVVGNELRRLVVSDAGKKVAAVRSNSGGDEIVITSFETVEAETNAPVDLLPTIKTIKPEAVEQGLNNNLRIAVDGENFSEGAALLVNGVEVATDSFNGGKQLAAALPKSLFKNLGEITVQVKRADESISPPVSLRVIKPQAPLIDSISPQEVPSPASNFTIKVKGKNFRQSSAIFVEGQQLETALKADGELQARVTAEMARSIKQLSIEVRDVATPELASNAKTLSVVSPSISEVKPYNDVIVAGDSSFSLKISGEHFNATTRVEINGETIPVSLTKRISDKLIVATVPGRFAQQAKTLAVTVRNTGGDVSNALNLEARAPEIKSSTPNEIAAGIRGTKVTINGENFRRGARVFLSDGKGQTIRVDRVRVKFVSKTQIIVNFIGKLKRFLAKPGEVQVKVVNPNRATGVDSEIYALKVSEPLIRNVVLNPITGDAANSRLLIDGSNFRRGAVIEFIKAGEVIRQQAPVNVKAGQISLVMPTRKAAALGSFSIRVINPGDIRSKVADVQHSEVASGKDE